jgi:hypothetical protein
LALRAKNTNILYRWPHTPSDIPSLLAVANWVGTELYLPKIVEDEFESQFVRAVEACYAKLDADVKELRKLSHNVLAHEIQAVTQPTQVELREAFRARTGQLKRHFNISSVPIQEVALETLLKMAINREEPFEEIELSKTRRVVAGLQDTVILFSIAKHMQTANESDRCAFLSNDGVFHKAGTKELLRASGWRSCCMASSGSPSCGQ